MAVWEEYFAKQIPPRNLRETKNTVCDFAAAHRASGRNVVLITVSVLLCLVKLSSEFAHPNAMQNTYNFFAITI